VSRAGWERKPLGEIVEFQRGLSISTIPNGMANRLSQPKLSRRSPQRPAPTRVKAKAMAKVQLSDQRKSRLSWRMAKSGPSKI